MSSLCTLCESVTVTTATASEAPMGTVLEFDQAGKVVNKTGKVARQVHDFFLSQRSLSEVTISEGQLSLSVGYLRHYLYVERSWSEMSNGSSGRRSTFLMLMR